MTKLQNTIQYDPWPALSFSDFGPTAHLLHRSLQVLGKLKLATPFEPHWSNVPLWITPRGLTTGPIPYGLGTYAVEMDVIAHQIICITSFGQMSAFQLTGCSVAAFTSLLLGALQSVGIHTKINMNPQEVTDPIPFHEDTKPCPYDASLVNAWWRILVSSQRVLQIFHARFRGITPPIGFMWGTSDLRDVRYLNVPAPIQPNSNIIDRNAFDVAQIECGWWPGDVNNPHSAYYSLPFPKPTNIEQAKVQPEKAYWNATMGEFMLDYEYIRTCANPEAELLAFFESTFQASSTLAGWDPALVGSGKPI